MSYNSGYRITQRGNEDWMLCRIPQLELDFGNSGLENEVVGRGRAEGGFCDFRRGAMVFKGKRESLK